MPATVALIPSVAPDAFPRHAVWLTPATLQAGAGDGANCIGAIVDGYAFDTEVVCWQTHSLKPARQAAAEPIGGELLGFAYGCSFGQRFHRLALSCCLGFVYHYLTKGIIGSLLSQVKDKIK